MHIFQTHVKNFIILFYHAYDSLHCIILRNFWKASLVHPNIMFYYVNFFGKWHVMILQFCCIVSARLHIILYDTFVKINMSHMSGKNFHTLPQEHIYYIFLSCHVSGRLGRTLLWCFNMCFTMLPLNLITLPYLIAERLYS